MTAVTKRIVCLANSRRNLERCVAGKELLASGAVGGWVRPVSSRPSEEVSAQERRYDGGGEPQLLDIIDIPLLEAKPTYYQQENWLLDPQRRWQRVGRVSPEDLDRLIDPVGALWIDGDSSARGRNDRIPFSDAASLDSSLCLIKVNSLKVTVSPPSKVASRVDSPPVLRGRFRHNDMPNMGCELPTPKARAALRVWNIETTRLAKDTLQLALADLLPASATS